MSIRRALASKGCGGRKVVQDVHNIEGGSDLGKRNFAGIRFGLPERSTG
jgi:hypothetical protein